MDIYDIPYLQVKHKNCQLFQGLDYITLKFKNR